MFNTTKKVKIDINKLWDNLGEDYFIRYTVDEIAWHTAAINKRLHDSSPLVTIRSKTARGGSEIFVYMKNCDNIFAATTRALDKLGLNIVNARIITAANDFTLDSYTILEKNGTTVNGKQRCDEIVQALSQSLTTLDKFSHKISHNKSRHLKHFSIPTKIYFSQDVKNNRNIMEVSTIDRPGILSRIGMAMDFCGISLQAAKIATYGARVEDIFFITDRNNRLITDPIKFECLENSIKSSLEN
jgi:[protein-PII] uridylyltransferase